jgi:hypothetical protein
MINLVVVLGLPKWPPLAHWHGEVVLHVLWKAERTDGVGEMGEMLAMAGKYPCP